MEQQDADAQLQGWSQRSLGERLSFLLQGCSLESLSDPDLRSLSPTALAYLGDAVYELFIRSFFLLPPCRIQDYHRKVVSQVRAEQQAFHLTQLLPHLTPPEEDILRKGRNASPRGPRRVNPNLYQQATGLETLLGYLFLTNPERLMTLLSHLDLNQSGSSDPGQNSSPG